MNDERFRKAFDEAWAEHIEPLFTDGSIVWECSPKLHDHLMKTANGEYSDEEVLALMDAGEM